ncbi:MAG: hypothetical protein C0402_11205 [Thermodesulfovibrio sp.]|nr:hypothetical protein [Thermodesulfovibrio sp.]
MLMVVQLWKKYSPICVIMVLCAVCPAIAVGENKIAAKIGAVLISETMVQEAVAQYVPPGGFHQMVTPAQKDKYRGEALTQLIEIELFYQGALKRRLTVAPEITERIIEDNIKRFGTRKRLVESLEKKQMTLKQLEARIEKIQVVKKFLQDLSTESIPTDRDLVGYYEGNKKRFMRPESVHLLHIMVKGDPAAPEEEWLKKREQTEGLLAEIKAGKDFGAVAYEKSEDAYRYKSGDVGFVHRGQFEFRDLEEAAFLLKEGELSSLLRSIYGFHILKALEKKPSQMLSFEESKETIRRELWQKTFDARKKALLEELKKEFPITLFDRPGDKGVAPAPLK